MFLWRCHIACFSFLQVSHTPVLIFVHVEVGVGERRSCFYQVHRAALAARAFLLCCVTGHVGPAALTVIPDEHININMRPQRCEQAFLVASWGPCTPSYSDIAASPGWGGWDPGGWLTQVAWLVPEALGTGLDWGSAQHWISPWSVCVKVVFSAPGGRSAWSWTRDNPNNAF